MVMHVAITSANTFVGENVAAMVCKDGRGDWLHRVFTVLLCWVLLLLSSPAWRSGIVGRGLWVMTLSPNSVLTMYYIGCPYTALRQVPFKPDTQHTDVIFSVSIGDSVLWWFDDSVCVVDKFQNKLNVVFPHYVGPHLNDVWIVKWQRQRRC